MLIIKADGSKWRLNADGTERPYRWWHALRDKAAAWWRDRDWRRRQGAFRRTGTRYYGDGGTIHGTGYVDVSIGPDGNVCSVWFRCQALPFKQHRADAARAGEMRRMYSRPIGELRGVEIKDP